MANRIIRNDFVAGIVTPEIFGRHDADVYFHGAKDVQNFIVRRTGGLRKRAGTELLWHVARPDGDGASREYKVIPFTFSKDTFGAVVIYAKGNVQIPYSQVFIHNADGTTASESEKQLSGVFALMPSELKNIRYKQIGDTLFLTLHGHNAVKVTVTITGSSVTTEWEQIADNITVPQAPTMKYKTANFRTDSSAGYVKAERKYRLWGVKDGVYSTPRDLTVPIYLEWVSGAYVDVSFTPNWAKHDYYVLGKLQGAQYGEISSYYPDLDSGDQGDSTFSNSVCSNTLTIGDIEYTAGSSSTTSWKTVSPEATDSSGINTAGTFCESTGVVYKSTSVPVLSFKLWFGAKCSHVEGGETVVSEVGLGNTVEMRIGTTEDASDVGSFDVIPQYGTTFTKLVPQTPKAAAKYWITFFTKESTPTRVKVPVRGVVLCSDTGTCTFHDDNIQPGTIFGEQDLLNVGDNGGGLDVDIIDVWQQRLIAASSPNMPFTFWASKTGDLYNWYANRPQTSDDAFQTTIACTEASKILHIVSQKWLLFFTESGEYIVSSSGAFAFNTVSVTKTSSVGAHPDVQPQVTESDVLFVAQDGRSVYQMRYSLEQDAVVPTSVSHRASHLTEVHRIKKIAYQRYPDSALWCLLDDGTCIALTYVQDENVIGWTRHVFSGGDGMILEDIMSAGSIRSEEQTDTTSDVMLVWRHPDNSGDLWIERLRPCVVVDNPDEANADCSDHIGYEASDYPLSADPKGAVDASLTTLKFEPQNTDTIGQQTNVYGSVLRLRRSGCVAARPEDGNLEWQNSELQRDYSPVHNDDGTVDLVSADVKLQLRAFNNRNTRIQIKSADNMPCNILSLEATVSFGNIRGE